MRFRLGGSTRLLACALAWACTACQAPGLDITAEPELAQVYVDGKALGAGPQSLPFRYYGTTTLGAKVIGESGPLELPRETRGGVRIPPPAPLWLFPLDFLVELAQLRDRPPVRAGIAVPERASQLTVGIDAPDSEGLASRAHLARIQR